MMKINFTIARILPSLIVVLFIVSCQVLVSPGPPAPSPSHIITSNNLNWREIWRQTLWLSYGSGVPMASAINNKIILPASNGHETDLTALDSQNGQVLWASKLSSPDRPDGRVVHSLFADTEQVFVALPFVIESFQTTDGKHLWTSETLPGHTRYGFLPPVQNYVIQILSGQGAEGALVYNLNIDNGQIKSTQSYPVWSDLKTDTVSYHIDNASYLICIDNKTNKTLWKVGTGGQNGGLELVNSKALIYAAGPHLTWLAAVDPASGETLWHTTAKDIASNFIVISSTVYALTSNATILAFDIFTGQEIGRIAFSGNPLDTDHASEYWLLTADSKLFAYFGDSQELIAFEPNR